MRPIALTISPVASDDNGIAESQTPAAGGAQALTLTASTITYSQPCHILITSAADDAARTFTVTGTDRYGEAQTEAIAGANGAAEGAKNFATVTGVSVDDDTAGAVIVGNADALESAWVVLDNKQSDTNVGLSVELSTGADFTYSVQFTLDNVFDVGEAAATPFAHASVASETTSQAGSFTIPVFAIRVAISSYVAGTATLNVLQSTG